MGRTAHAGAHGVGDCPCMPTVSLLLLALSLVLVVAMVMVVFGGRLAPARDD